MIILVIVVVAYLIYNRAGDTEPGTTTESFAQCITTAGLKMYGTEWCSFCKQQKAIFGDSFKDVDYIDCDKNKELCTTEEIRGYPTWKINGESYPSVQSLEKLAQLSGCDL